MVIQRSAKAYCGPLVYTPRVFAKIERELKKKEVIITPAQYVSVLEEHGSATKLSSIAVYDWKRSYESIIKPTTSWNFPFMKSKRIFLTRTKTDNIFVQGEVNYRSELNKKIIITKKNKKITMINTTIISPNTIIPKKSKVQDVTKLLEKHFGNDWRNLDDLDYYKNIEEKLNNANFESFGINDDREANEDLCEHMPEEVNLQI